MINFCYDDLGDFSIGYPNLARRDIEPWQFDDTWPRVVPMRLLMYMVAQNIQHSAHLVENAPVGSWYPVAWAWHDFTVDYVGLCSDLVRERLRAKEIRLFFYYHEGDNPSRIVPHLQQRCQQHQVPIDCFLLVSANSAAQHLAQACYFPDHEYFFRWLNRRQSPARPTPGARQYKFTALNRLHKSWRAYVMADLHKHGLLDRSIWSYNTDMIMDSADSDNPLDSAAVQGWVDTVQNFLSRGPYFCDGTDADAHNDHTLVNAALYTQSSCHIVFETLMDADGSGGSFLTEKTYKCIKYAQPFVIVGTSGSLAQLRQDGYRTFDSVWDNSYDDIVDNTQRYLAIRRLLGEIQRQDGRTLLERCLPDLEHNQRVFLDMQSLGLNRLLQRLK